MSIRKIITKRHKIIMVILCTLASAILCDYTHAVSTFSMIGSQPHQSVGRFAYDYRIPLFPSALKCHYRICIH